MAFGIASVIHSSVTSFPRAAPINWLGIQIMGATEKKNMIVSLNSVSKVLYLVECILTLHKSRKEHLSQLDQENVPLVEITSKRLGQPKSSLTQIMWLSKKQISFAATSNKGQPDKCLYFAQKPRCLLHSS